MSQRQLSFASQLLEFYFQIKPFDHIPPSFDMILPFQDRLTQEAMTSFYTKYFDDSKERVFLYGINPGRFGAGITGISFTDPVHLEQNCGIPNEWEKRKELSSDFIYRMIEAYGGSDSFYRQFYITSICPIGFLKDGKNANYYDDKELEKAVHDQVVEWMWDQIGFGARRDVAFSIGQGTNYKVFSRLNKAYGFFDEVKPLPHPRWVMQYRRKKLDIFVDQYCQELQKVI